MRTCFFRGPLAHRRTLRARGKKAKSAQSGGQAFAMLAGASIMHKGARWRAPAFRSVPSVVPAAHTLYSTPGTPPHTPPCAGDAHFIWLRVTTAPGPGPPGRFRPVLHTPKYAPGAGGHLRKVRGQILITRYSQVCAKRPAISKCASASHTTSLPAPSIHLSLLGGSRSGRRGRVQFAAGAAHARHKLVQGDDSEPAAHTVSRRMENARTGERGPGRAGALVR